MVGREMALREGPITFRNTGTIGGLTVGGDWESELLAALLVYEAQVMIETRAGERIESLPTFLEDVEQALDGGLLTKITLKITGKTAVERVARTPKDRVIVAAIGRLDDQGQIRLALCGIAKTPVLVEPDQLAGLDPLPDFRGTAEYRRKMAVVLGERVLSALETE